jgi:hypothetical protein
MLYCMRLPRDAAVLRTRTFTCWYRVLPNGITTTDSRTLTQAKMCTRRANCDITQRDDVAATRLICIREVFGSYLFRETDYPEIFCGYPRLLHAYIGIVSRLGYGGFFQIYGALISHWLYKENKLRDWKNVPYLLYIFPPQLHTLMTLLF